ncbi:LysM peptidoglycan-binding domain-containing protein [Cytobacillus oceanisediminis]|uniref:3D domain-containing protein n=1 Tax=Cytobacillus oceanisediminis TaxID=665099 RepID=UPI0023DBBDFF|nr:LysM peptidoglycan-binding domain-containing protein [Cytobacillus oceanisediminis]MDF2035638.1 LysM peptidoglycan-binding domain-containing protein [Cytobacillus oceanisediminis]
MKKSILSFVAAAAITGTAGANVQAEEVTVKKGDTLWDFSQAYNTPVDMIKEWNGLSSHIIHPDDVLNVYPEKKYIVSKGDTLWDIAREHNVTAEAIKEWNNLSSDLILPDKELILYPNAKAVNAAVAAVKAPAKSEKPAETVSAPVQKSEQPAAKQKQPVEKSQPAPEAKPAAEAEAEAPAESANKETAHNVLNMEATAYTADCEGCSGITATGINLKENPDQKVISVDPNVIPLGTKVHVEGYGNAVAGDTGGAIKGNKIDIFMPSQEDAINFGRKTVKVTILD